MTKETTKRVVLLSDEEIERLLDWTEGDTSAPDCDPDDEGLCTLCEARDNIRAALDQPQGGERVVTVYQVAGDRVGWRGPVRIFPATEHLQAARDDLASFDHSDSAYSNVRILEQTTITGPWQDIDQQEGEQDG